MQKSLNNICKINTKTRKHLKSANLRQRWPKLKLTLNKVKKF